MDQTGGASGEQPNRIQVVVRVRPVLPHELSDDVAVTCSQDARKLQVLLPDRLAGGAVLPGATRSGARSYEFDACLPGQTTQEELYDICGLSELVDAALDGYCVTVFAFGQTGSGKTHTIIGPRLSRGAAAGAGATTRLGSAGSVSDEPSGAAAGSSASASGSRGPSVTGVDGGATMGRGGAAAGPPGGILVDPEDGILTRAIAAAYRSMEARSAGGGVEFSVSASVVELYNESVTDLLALDKSKTLAVRKDARDGFAVTGLTQVACPSDVSAVRYLVKALQYRHTRGHKLNEYSSRSHCIMTFVFASKEAGLEGQTGAKGGIRRYGKLALVDLAGSERLKDTGNTEKGAVRETGAINKSLFTLGQVLSALSARSCGATSTFVPYRDSKLTQLLWDGLRGSGRCLMLACLGPMRAAAEESLNTLHFATMATRIKAEPVVLLDPQDALVLELRKTITELRNENRTLAGALQQLSNGIEPGAVLAGLPDMLRQQAGATASAAAAAGGGGSPGDVTPQRPGHLQPLAAPGPLRQSYSADGPGASSFDGYPSASPSPSAMGYGVSGGVAPLRPTPSPVGARGASGEVGSPSRVRDGRQPRFSGAGPPPGSGGPGRRPAPLSMGSGAYGASPSPMRAPAFPPQSADAALGPGRSAAGAGAWRPGNGGAAAAASGKSSPSQRSRSVGRNGGAGAGFNRPSYLTEEPAALLHGYSNVLQPPPPSSNASSTSVGMGGPAGGGAGPRRGATMPVAPPPPALDEFPELAAMEAEFQNLMANSGGGSGFNAVSALKSATGGAGPGGGPAARPPPAPARSSVTGASDSGVGEGRDGEDDGGPKPDVRALKWAERNHWFGTDYEMTAYAYKVHDKLVDNEHVDPTSDIYYMEIERRVAERFPDKWAKLMPRDALPGGSGAAAAAAVRRAAPSPGRVRPPGEAAGGGGTPPRPPATNFGAGLRVAVKDPLYGSGGASSGSFGYGELQLGGGTYDLYGGAAQVPYSLGTTPVPGTPNSLAGAGGSGAINPFNIGALHSMAPPKGAAVSRFAPGGGGGQGLVLTPAGAGSDGAYGFGGASGGVGGDPNAAERIAKEYARQRAMVVEELRRAKEEAEAERQRILARIQRAAGGSKWR
ncbi:hypothetical protein HYH02_010302 [Chlamydomonas schloesseri]|uniref:Kinesin motor domain-containing protein n=1 Tax=Chlamydomonas schloesseri TaxID=2026947 RepID=A0A835W7T1_9CHLO|nr:hypothetical protein HYH02_010302 [Chlamydomonas schloesseri]|eukprot:KAG2440414.1 hypothetical protein HYH02_010302 [Chlamydomonas schloesseri]